MASIARFVHTTDPKDLQRPGARAFVAQYTTTHARANAFVRHKRKKSHTPDTFSPLQGATVDDYLSAFVHSGWLDFESTCDALYAKALQAGEKAALASERIRRFLVAHDFVAIDTQLRAPAYGLCPILDLVGINAASGALCIVEIKCGSSTNDTRSDISMLSPFDDMPCCGRTLSLLQLAVQYVCLKHRLEVCFAAHGSADQLPERMRTLHASNSCVLVYNTFTSKTGTGRCRGEYHITMIPLTCKLAGMVQETLVSRGM